jgi:hypothetical protein
LDEHELAWAAGFFDGDGWAALVRPRRRRTGQPQAQINQSSPEGVPEVLVRFRDAVGVGRIGGPKIEDGREPLYWWVASSRHDVDRTGRLIVPWLSGQKREQFHSAVGLRSGAPPINTFPWAAGLFDAEGSTSLSAHQSHAGYKVIESAVTQGGFFIPEELRRFAACVVRGRVYGPYEQDGATKPIYRWRACTVDDVRSMLHLILPWLGAVKRRQAVSSIATIDAQPALPRGRAEWGSHKSHCIHGHEYASARIRPYVSRGVGLQRRDSKQCLQCTREQARARRSNAGPQRDMGGTTC